MLKNLTSRERVEIALEHKEPDRVPCDLTISPDAYAVLCDYLNCKYEPYWWDDCNHAFPSIEVLEKLGVDIYHIPAVNFVPKDFSTDKTEFKDQWGNTKRKIKDSNESFMYVSVDNPLKDAETVDDILSYSCPSPEGIVNFDGLEEMVKHIYKETNMAITATVGGHVFEQPHFLRGFENFLVDLCINEEIACALMDKVLEINLSVEKLIFKTIGNI